MAIKSIAINSLRGIKELELPLNGKGLVIFGENGTGKSSIVDALEFFFTGSISHLRSSQSLSVKNHGKHARSKQSDLKVTLEFNPGGKKITRTFSPEFQCPKEYERLFEDAKKGTFILRRSQIMNFIQNKPAQRFDVISNILGFENLNNFEHALNGAVHHFERVLESKKRDKSAVLNQLSEELSTNIQDTSTVLDILNKPELMHLKKYRKRRPI
jgi:DNA repair exonuclease SbcCD ATPase subunit